MLRFGFLIKTYQTDKDMIFNKNFLLAHTNTWLLAAFLKDRFVTFLGDNKANKTEFLHYWMTHTGLDKTISSYQFAAFDNNRNGLFGDRPEKDYIYNEMDFDGRYVYISVNLLNLLPWIVCASLYIHLHQTDFAILQSSCSESFYVYLLLMCLQTMI